MAHINRFNTVSNIAGKNAGTLLFAALLIVCAITVGCSKDNPQPASTQTPATPATPAVSSNVPPASPPQQTENKTPKKVARKRPSTVTYTDKTYGVSFQYPRKYALETGDAANELIASSSVPMNFVQPGGVALAAVALPDTSYPGTDFESGLFNVSINKSLTEEQCGAFSVPQVDPKTADSGTTAKAPLSKLMLGDLELQSVENIAGEGSKQSDAKYFHVFQNGACYEFAVKVATNGSENETGGRHVNRDQVFQRLEKMLATVKINPTAAPEVAVTTPKDAPKEAATPETPAQ